MHLSIVARVEFFFYRKKHHNNNWHFFFFSHIEGLNRTEEDSGPEEVSSSLRTRGADKKKWLTRKTMNFEGIHSPAQILINPSICALVLNKKTKRNKYTPVKRMRLMITGTISSR